MSDKTCAECKYHDKYSCLKLKDNVLITSTHLACIRFSPKNPTNGDQLRQMSNEELRTFLLSYRNSDCEKYCVRPCMFCADRCNDATLAWLYAPSGMDIDVHTEESDENNARLKPCPFCGGEIEFVSAHVESGWCVHPPTIYCSKCHQDYLGATVSMGDKCDAQREEFADSLLVKWWNRRPVEDKKDYDLKVLNFIYNKQTEECENETKRLRAKVDRLRETLKTIVQNSEFWDDEDDSLAIIHKVAGEALTSAEENVDQCSLDVLMDDVFNECHEKGVK